MGMQKEIGEHFQVIRNELKNSGAIEEITGCQSPLTGVWNSNGGFDWEGKDPNLAVDFPNNGVTYEFGKTVNWKIKDGRDFSRNFATDSLAFIINESAVQFLGFQDPVGKTLKWDNKPYIIVGIVNGHNARVAFLPGTPNIISY
jgi:hypothetical protein